MTDRRTGGTGANADLSRTGIINNRETGGLGVNVDLTRTGIVNNRETGMVGVNVDLAVAALSATQRQTGGVGTNVDLTRLGIVTNRQTGMVGVMLDLAGSSGLVTPVRWAGLFNTGTSDPLVYWASGTFQSSGSKPTVWQTDHFDIAP